jgi:hypothetical protein
MRFIVNHKNTYNQQIIDLFKINYINKEYTPEYQYKCILHCDYWFILYNEKTNDIIAECSVSIENDDVLKINDVLVIDKYRGLRYSELLLMNVIYYFEENKKKLLIKISCDINNIPAYRCYKKIFDEPYKTDKLYAYFSFAI